MRTCKKKEKERDGALDFKTEVGKLWSEFTATFHKIFKSSCQLPLDFVKIQQEFVPFILE
jgi:hypothetical protein